MNTVIQLHRTNLSFEFWYNSSEVRGLVPCNKPCMPFCANRRRPFRMGRAWIETAKRQQREWFLFAALSAWEGRGLKPAERFGSAQM
ncbi:hypothetical protein KBA41_17640, partial [Candidatus Ozemobacteraceae bacterium]|nr:hypothetical protein [Candidatus Ozemobacteraceae bacterium]